MSSQPPWITSGAAAPAFTPPAQAAPAFTPPAQAGGGDWAAAISNAEIVNSSGRYFEPGQYVAELVEIKQFLGGKAKNQQKWGAVFRVIESTNPTVSKGTELSWFHNLAKDEYGFSASDIRMFYSTIQQVYGAQPTDPIDPNLARSSAGPQQILKGTIFKIDAYLKGEKIVKLSFEVVQLPKPAA